MNKKLIKLSSLGLVVLLSLTACSEFGENSSKENTEIVENEEKVEKEDAKEANEDENKGQDEEEITKEEENPSEFNEKLAKLYNKVLDEIDSYEFQDLEEGKYTYSYSLVNTDDTDFPKLLVAQDTEYGLSYLKLFEANDDYTDVLYDDELLSIGVASAGGFRGFIAQNADYDALIYTTFMSGTGKGQEEKITTSVEDDNLNLDREVIWEGRIDTKAEDDSSQIEFIEIEDRDKLYDLAKISDGEYVKSLEENDEKEETSEGNEEVQAAGQKEGESLESKIQAESRPGTMVASGEVRVFNHDEMVAYQQFNPEMLPDRGEYYTVLILDKPMDFTLISGDGFGEYTRSASLISLPEDMMDYDGQYITISFTNTDGYWQSDVSLPMDAPRMHQVKVVE